MTGAAQLDRVRTALEAAGNNPGAGMADANPLAVGWATVELERAVATLAGGLDLSPDAFVDAPDDVALGAACRVAHGVLPGGASLVVLEPVTEGRLAAMLARLDEGPVAVWLAVPGPWQAVAALDVAGVGISGESPGPFGSERLILEGPIHGPYRLLVQSPPVTIRP